ncbi:MAG: BtaA family protein [Microscillaceae bacterium]
MFKVGRTLNQLRDKIFSNVHNNNLIYNTCWEDPRCDRQMMQYGEKSHIVMITSAGCNALDYLLDNPARIDCIDVNPRQNALLALKIAAFQTLDYRDFWLLFGEGHHPRAVEIYAKHLKGVLPDYAQAFWDRAIIHFTKKSFYYFGTSGTVAWLFKQYAQTRPKIRKAIAALLEANTLEEQKRLYEGIEPKIITQVVKWLMNRHLTMTMLGVPRAQRQLIVDEYPGKVAGFVADCLRHVFTELPVHDNYFWRLYLTGGYTPECCPEYLKAYNFETLRERVKRLHLHTTYLNEFLRQHPERYTHYVLLDHQDWLAAHDTEALIDEWNLILKNSQHGTRILLRSAALRVDFFPDFVPEALEFQTDITEQLHPLDRVGTYGSVYLGLVK